MGGLDNRTPESNTYLSLFAGKFTKKVKTPTENSVSRVNKKGVTVHELLYNTLADVTLMDIQKVRHENYGLQWEFHLKFMDEKFILTLPYSSGPTKGILFRLPNVDVNKPMTLVGHYFEGENGEPNKAAITITQNGSKVEYAYSKEIPNGLPPLEKIMVKGEEKNDDTKQMQFIEQMLDVSIRPQLNAAKEVIATDASNAGDYDEYLKF
jgi:hypothetical protein